MSTNLLPPAPRGAGALHGGRISDELGDVSGEPEGIHPSGGADALQLERVHLYRENGVEYLLHDNLRFVRDVDLARLVGFSRPRNIRKLLGRMVEEGDIPVSDVAILDDEFGGRVHYLNQMAAVKVAMRSEASNKEAALVSMLAAFGRGGRPAGESMPVEKALAAFERTLGRIGREKDRAIRAAYIPVLQRYARMAGVPVPPAEVLIGSAVASDQPRLPGV